MPDSKAISGLTTAESLGASDLLEVSIVNALTETGYISRKITVTELARVITTVLQYSSALNTNAKTITGAINEVLRSVSGGVELEETLEAGETSITFTNAAVLTSSTFDFYTDVWGVNPKTVTVIQGAITLTFDAQENDIAVKVVIR